MRAIWMALLAMPILAGCGPETLFGTPRPVEGSKTGITASAPTGTLPEIEPGTAPQDPTVPADFLEVAIQHPFFPAEVGRTWTYEGFSDGQRRRDEVRVLDAKTIIAGVSCTAIFQEVFLDGRLSEVTTEFYAQDAEGNVWKFGEESMEFDGNLFRPALDPWMAGVDGAQAWILFPVAPRAGDIIRGRSSGGDEIFHVLAMDVFISLPSGDFSGCMQLLENPQEPEDTDIILFAEEVGMVSEQSPDGQIDLVGYTK